MNKLAVFLLGAATGAVAAALFTPESGDDLRAHIRALLRRRGLLPHDEMEAQEFIELITQEVLPTAKS